MGQASSLPGRNDSWAGWKPAPLQRVTFASICVILLIPLAKLGFEAIEDHVHVSDLHATILHLMGLDHRHLTYLYNGLERRLTGPDEERYQVVKRALA